MRRLAASAFAAMLVAGCGVGDESTSESGLELSDLSGVWGNDEVTLRVNDAGDFIVLPAGSEELLMSGFVARDGQRLVFVTGIGRAHV